jgi:VWFA-related protein
MAGAVVLGAAVTLFAGIQDQKPPQFRGRTDLVTLDVSVLDRNRQPVRGLTAADFTIKEDGKLQSVESFASVDIPDPVPPSAAWMRDVAPDVQSNQLDDRRLVVMVLDSWPGPSETWESRTGKKVARDIIDRLGPADLMAIIVVLGAQYAQDFTNDRSLLLRAVEQKEPSLSWASVPDGFKPSGDFVSVMADVTDYLADLPDRRKAIIYVGKGGRWGGRGSRDSDVLWKAKRANVNIYPFDLNGLRPPEVGGQGMILDPGQGTREMLLSIAENTGGDATVNTNRPTDGVPQIFVENGSYYLLGYVSTNTKQDGRIRRIDVAVNRPRVTVRTRRGYTAPLAQQAAAGTPAPPVVQNAIAGLLPSRAVTMETALAPFAVPGRREAALAIAIGARTAADDIRRTDVVEVLTRAFTPVGDPQGEQLQRMRIAAGPSGRAYDVLTQIALAPGRYAMRLSTRDIALDRTGSVYAFVEVPDFAREPISLSGAVVSVDQSLSGPSGALSALIPVVPTTRRTFDKTQHVTVFLRAYQGGRDPIRPSTLRVRIVNDSNSAVLDRTDVAPVERFDPGTRSFDYLFELPLGALEPGQYLLTFDAALDERRIATRSVRFSVAEKLK